MWSIVNIRGQMQYLNNTFPPQSEIKPAYLYTAIWRDEQSDKRILDYSITWWLNWLNEIDRYERKKLLLREELDQI